VQLYGFNRKMRSILESQLDYAMVLAGDQRRARLSTLNRLQNGQDPKPWVTRLRSSWGYS
jgi:hypothetical protein